MDIAKLVHGAKKGNGEAFELLIESVREKLYRTAYAYVRNEQDALDIYQETIRKRYQLNSEGFEEEIKELELVVLLNE